MSPLEDVASEPPKIGGDTLAGVADAARAAAREHECLYVVRRNPAGMWRADPVVLTCHVCGATAGFVAHSFLVSCGFHTCRHGEVLDLPAARRIASGERALFRAIASLDSATTLVWRTP